MGDRETGLISLLQIARELLRSLESRSIIPRYYIYRIYRFLTTSCGFRKKRRWISNNSGPFCDVNIIKHPPAYLRAARKRPLRGGPILGRTYDPQEARRLSEKEKEIQKRGGGTTVLVSAVVKAQFYAPRGRLSDGRGPSTASSLSSPLSVFSFRRNYQDQRMLYELSEP